ncbi:MAG: hypothetical protein U5N86_00635 [Planctomycetota bacterium]|nr:hypothetical protein [Planctomycetota bacterium]
MKLTRAFLFLVVLALMFGYFATAEEAGQTPAENGMSFKQSLDKFAPYLFMVKDGQPEGEEEVEEADPADMRARMMRRFIYQGWRIGYLVSDDMMMYPFNLRVRQMRKRAMEEGEVAMGTCRMPDGTMAIGMESGMSTDLGLVFTQIALPEGYVPRKLNFDNQVAAKIGEQVVVIGRRGEEWGFEPFFLPAMLNGKLNSDGKMYYSLTLTQEQLGGEAMGALVVTKSGMPLGIVSSIGEKTYSNVVVPLTHFSAAIKQAKEKPQELKQIGDLPDLPRGNRPGMRPGGERPGGNRGARPPRPGGEGVPPAN